VIAYATARDRTKRFTAGARRRPRPHIEADPDVSVVTHEVGGHDRHARALGLIRAERPRVDQLAIDRDGGLVDRTEGTNRLIECGA
jgi:hypothetical protein